MEKKDSVGQHSAMAWRRPAAPSFLYENLKEEQAYEYRQQ